MQCAEYMAREVSEFHLVAKASDPRVEVVLEAEPRTFVVGVGEAKHVEASPPPYVRCP